MSRDVFTFLVGGKAGEGVKKAGSTAAGHLALMGRHVFQMDDYQSLIRGGHNFSVVSSSVRAVTSHFMRADLVVALDALSYDLHREHLADGGVVVYNSDQVSAGPGVGLPMTSEAAKYPRAELRVGVAGAAALAAGLGLDRGAMLKLIAREYARDVENNIAYAGAIYDAAVPALGGRFRLEGGGAVMPIVSGNEAIGLGAAAAGLDAYFAYPMTPSSSLLHFLAAHDRDLGIAVVHAESEIAVANMAIGAAFAGARSMVGTSGGGFALMVEALSLAGMTEAPILCLLAQRSGPSTGVPTYTEQGDLGFALNPGHGEFPTIVASPGSVEEAFRLSAELLALVWRCQAVGILLSEKHLTESSMTVRLDPTQAAWAEPVGHPGGAYARYAETPDGVSPLAFPPSREVIKWNSYEHDAVFRESRVQSVSMQKYLFSVQWQKKEISLKDSKGLGSGRMGRWINTMDVYNDEYNSFEKIFGTYLTFKSHNQYIGFLVQVGALGLLLFLLIMFVLIKKIVKKHLLRRDPLNFMGLIMLVAMLIYALGYMSFTFTGILWITMMLVSNINERPVVCMPKPARFYYARKKN